MEGIQFSMAGDEISAYDFWEETKECVLDQVPREVAARIAFEAEGAPICGVLQTLFKPDKGRNPGIRFGI